MLKGTVQVDLDGLWTVLGYYGKRAEIAEDPIFYSAIPRFIELFDEYNIKATFFVIAKDLEIAKKRNLVKKIVQKGHEIASHSYSHAFGFRNLTHSQKVLEVQKADSLIQKISGKKPVGFKAPGYDMDESALRIIKELGYSYDSSVLPSFFYPPLQLINGLISFKIRTHGPKMVWGFAPNRPYRPSPDSIWKQGNFRLIEVPSTVIPVFRFPFQTVFVYMAGLSLFRFGYSLVKRNKIPINYTFHAIDLSDDIRGLPAAQKTRYAKRKRICEYIIKSIAKDYKIMQTKKLLDKNGI